MSELKVGMYVRASVDYEDDKNPRLFALGQVEEILEDGKVRVVFYKNYRKSNAVKIDEFIPGEDIYEEKNLTRCKILKNSKVIHYYEVGEIICLHNKNEDGFNFYYMKTSGGNIKLVSEQEIMVDFNRGNVSPYMQMLNYEFHAPFWYAKRKVASESLHILNNFGESFKTLIGTRAYLFEHQIDTIIKGLSKENCRLMLADEVGLGKTIEALVMLKGLKKDNEKILLIIPEALVNQWQHELDSKLWMESVIYNGSNLNYSDIVIVPVEMVAVVSAEKLVNIFDYCVIDEVHRIIGEKQLYDKMLYICKNIKNVLLLSATPIQNRKEEYLQLLKLLNPEKYEYMTEREFTELFEKNSNIRRLVYRVYRDLPSAYGEDIDMDEVEEIYECIEDIKYELEDKCLNKIFDEIDIYSGDNGEEKIREILAYISITYQFEKNIIRHRREELKDMLPKRAQDSIFYVMKSASDNYYENECYEKVVQYIENLKSNNQWTEELGEYVRVILNSMFSSPWALNYVLETRKSALKKAIRFKFNYVTVAYSQRKERERIHRIISSIHTFTEEKKLLDEVIFYLRKWTVAAEKELENIDELMDNPDNIKGRLGKVIDYLEQELYEEKVVIFSSWVETLEKLRNMLVKLYGEETVATFNINDSADELEKNVYRFQNNKECRFMLCDELGGEGRNFQIADAIVHIDMPFLPTILEQRIGRLDRIGRDSDKEVLNIVVASEDTIEMSLFDLWNEGLNIFNESLSGLEIALEDINRDIITALKSDMKYGLYESIDKIKAKLKIMKKSVEEERYYDMASQLDDKTKRNYEKLINNFDKDGGELLAQMMLDWSRAVGLTPINSHDDIVEFGERSISKVSMQKTMFSIPDTSACLKKSKRANLIRGTFKRDIAVKKEDLVFFAPGDEIFDSIMTNVEEDFKGKSIALRIPYAPFEWEGFILRWNSNFNMNALLDKGINIKYSSYSNGNMPIDQIVDIIPVDQGNTPLSKVKEYIDGELINFIYKKRGDSHLGKRSNGNITIFKKNNTNSFWRRLVYDVCKQSKENVRKKYNKSIDSKKINREFSQTLATARASEKYYEVDENSDELKEILSSVMKGIINANLEMDSILYLKLVKDNV